MRRVLMIVSLVAAIAACHDRLGPNDRLVPSSARVSVGTPVYRGATVVGHVARVHPLGNQLLLTFQFASDSVAPASLADLQVKTTGLASAHVFVIATPPVVPPFGPGGHIPRAAARR
jgi:hypothetical protein